MNSDFAQTLLRKTRGDYQMIAERYSATREDVWPEFQEFQKYIQPNDRILDVGCGNGRLTKIFDKVKVNYTGIDISPRMLEQAKKLFPNHTFQMGDILSLPFPENHFNIVFCLSVLHQIPSIELRRKAMEQLYRVTRSGGKLVLVVWNLWRPRYRSKIRSINIKKLFGFTPLDKNDLYITWRDSGIKQYYHAFTQKELEELITQAGYRTERIFLGRDCKGEKGRYFNNIVVIASKP